MELRDKIAKRLKQARDESGLSQEQVATMLNLKRPSISEIESGRRKVSAEELVQFSEIYKVRLSWLAGKDSEVDTAIEDKLSFAAREASNIKEDDLDRVIKILSAFKGN